VLVALPVVVLSVKRKREPHDSIVP
jgi:hypothetical protein